MSGSFSASNEDSAVTSRPTRTSVEFYNADGRGLVDRRNYSSAILQHLDCERALLSAALVFGGYTAAVEVGCADGDMHLSAFLEHGVRYVGIDVVPSHVCALNERIKGLPDSHRARASVLEACSLSRLAPELRGEKVLVVFPFNAFGNIEGPDGVLDQARVAGFDLLIFTYRTDPDSTALRGDYYARCRLEQLRCAEETAGIVFRSVEGLCSYAYHRPWLIALLRKYADGCGSQDFGMLGRCYWARCRREA